MTDSDSINILVVFFSIALIRGVIEKFVSFSDTAKSTDFK